MKVIGKQGYKEIQAENGKYLKKGNSYFTKCIMLPSEAETDYTEVNSIPDVESESDYKKEVEELVREKYSVSDELGLIRQRDIKPDEFKAYFDFVESCKTKAKNDVPNQ